MVNMEQCLTNHRGIYQTGSKSTAAKGHQCDVCLKQFNRNSSLRRHMVIHTGQYRYQCSLCDKKFQTKENFTGHMNVHAGAKPFQCPQCLKCFARKNKLSAHKRECFAWTGNSM